MERREFYVALLSGGIAGTSVDVSLFPLDTVKTRIQSPKGFVGSGGFRGVYSGLASAAFGSAPTAALFFCVYESVRSSLSSTTGKTQSTAINMAAASMAEVAACLIRVPVEVVKQRAQSTTNTSSFSVLRQTLKSEGIFGFYRGFVSTVCREVPFSFIQFPLWEYFKIRLSEYQGHLVLPWQSSICGAVSGAVSASITTPLDVAKTRIILAQKDSELASGRIMYALRSVHKEKGVRGLYAGILPRMMWISIGGAVFLGVYDKSKSVLNHLLERNNHPQSS